MKVIARTSSFAFKNKNIDVRTIGGQLGVSTVLEGSVRKAKNRVRITAQLISTDDGTHFWSKNFDRELEDIFVLQDEISILLADQIRENFGHIEIPSSLNTSQTHNVKAYDLWLKGSYHLKRKDFEDIKNAMKFFKAAIKVDPNYAEAYAFLGETYIHAAALNILPNEEGNDLARNAANKAIELNVENAKAHMVLAYIELFSAWNWEAALIEYDKAIKYGQSDQNEFITYYYIFIKEDFERAIEVAKMETETDPLHVHTHWQLGLTYYFARRFEKSIIAFNKALEIDPNYAEALRFRGLVQAYLGNYKEALIDINGALELIGGLGLANLDLLVVKILMGKKEEVLAVLKKSKYVDSSDPAVLYSLLNMPDEAIYWLDKAYEERSTIMATLKIFWVWDNLRDHTRFKEIYAQMNFPPSIKNKHILEPINIAQTTFVNPSLLNEKEIENYLEQLDQLMKEDQVYLDPAISLRLLAEKLDMQPNKLSWLLNEQIGKNFNEYINAYRLIAFKEKALNPNNSNLTLLGLAYDSGFNSKTVFNAFFKKMEGMTPKTWVKSHKK
ncbi:helix-turn-helix domain-containing protein [Roseivirga sp.]|uniref:helix-turn-helix domain-containing protein n=1 Tax=Roseivirga sp. TaxID=1964215 RepID=UPI002B274138|nr:helix-turn-helix domain-containing protein [Roseivirga sp.]